MKYSIRRGWIKSALKTPPARLGHPQSWARMSSGTRPTLAGVFLSSLAVIALVESASSPEVAACAAPPSGARWSASGWSFPALLLACNMTI